MASSKPSKYTSKLNDARVLVIGGTSGIGFGIAEALLEHNASVIISSSSEDRVSKGVQRLKSTNSVAADGRIQGMVCNLGSQDTVESEVRELFSKVAAGGKLDHVVYTAGDVLAVGKFEDFSLKDIRQAGMVRFFGPLVVAQQLRHHLKEGPASSFIMTTGGMSQRPFKDWSVIMSYSTGLEGMCRGLARDLAPIRVNLVGVGPVETEIWASHRETTNFDEMKSGIASWLATGAIGEVEDVVESYLGLMKDKNATGSMVFTNGGGLLM